MANLKINIIPALKDNYIFALHDNKDVIIIDPSEAEPVIDFIEEKSLKLKFILNTHHHWDHIGGNNKLKQKYKAKIIAFDERIDSVDQYVKDEEIIRLCENNFQIYHIPGHTSGHIMYHWIERNILFVGDSLFVAGCGRVFDGTFEQLYNSLQLIKSFNENTVIYCAHEYSIQNLQFAIKLDESNKILDKKMQEFQELRARNLPTIPTDLATELKINPFLKAKNFNEFYKIRTLKDKS